MADEVNATGWAFAGYTDMHTSDCVTHGQVKQSGKFSFVRLFGSGHEAPFFTPLAALEASDLNKVRLSLR